MCAQALDLDDTVLEVNATPNRGDCMSVFGIARDYAAAHERRYLQAPVQPVAAAHRSLPRAHRVRERLSGFRSRVIRGVAPGATSPAWLRERLRRVGLDSISPIVDVTNYVMMELGQPCTPTISRGSPRASAVRKAQPEERITLLERQEYELDPEFLVIADASGPIGLAGIMGGKGTAIGDRHARRAARSGALHARRGRRPRTPPRAA